MYGSVLFTPLEAARARALRPQVLGGGDDEARAFTPERGSVRIAGDERLAVALVDGACGYLKDDGRCWLHILGGEGQKPRGCSVYPVTFVDDGESVRVSVCVECACVAVSVGRSGGVPLADPAALSRGDLGPGARVAALPEAIAVAHGANAKRADFVAWAKLVAGLAPDEDSPGDHDVVAVLWSLAGALDAAGLDAGATRAAIAEPEPPSAEALAPWIEALVARAEARAKAADAWRGQRDRSRLASRWIASAATALRGPAALESALGSAARFGRDERFWLRAMVHGHQLAGDVPVSVALRDRAVRALLSRALPEALPVDEAARAHPVALVEAMMRGHGLGAYAAAVSAGP
jgi:lysine-N-methylase